MKVIDPGHHYALQELDGDGEGERHLIFVKREGEGYPRNVGHHSGTNCQEVLRAVFDRLGYLDGQIEDLRNSQARHHIAQAIWLLECRAADRHGRPRPTCIAALANETCQKCGHVDCTGACRSEVKTAV
jgi:hypothetical protein